MNLYYNFLCYFFCLLILNSCAKKNTFVTPPLEEIEITELFFSKELNSSLTKDVILVEDNGVFTAKLPSYIKKELVLSYQSNAFKIMVDGVVQVSEVSVLDYTNPIKVTLIGESGVSKDIQIKISWFDIKIPHIVINVEGGQEITSKSNYLKGDMSITGNELYPDFSGTTEIRGRGNSTWRLPKKPYRLKLSSKSEILGLPSAKNWVLLANFIDPSLMCNTVAMKIGRDLGLPFTNEVIPVDLTINGSYRGSYLLTQQVEVGENRVNVGNDGLLFEFDTNYDEDYKFRSSRYNLPVMMKYPDLNSSDELLPIRNEFQLFENKIFDSNFPNNNYRDLFDIDAFAKFILVYFMTGNQEINHPKSIYMYKKASGKYTFGPIWDFDWAYGYNGGQHFIDSDLPLFWSGNAIGAKFFKRLFEDPQVQSSFKREWIAFKNNKFDNLLKYIDEYAVLITESKGKDELIWKKGVNFSSEISRLKTYLRERAVYIDSFIAEF